MATIAETVAIIAPQYANDARVSAVVGYVVVQMGAVAWGSQYVAGAANLAAHVLTLADRGTRAGTTGWTGAGPLASMSEGQSSVSFGMPAGLTSATLGDASLSTTQYGLEYMRLRSLLAVRTGTWVR